MYLRKSKIVNFDKNILEASLPTEFGEFVLGVWNMAKGSEVVYLRTVGLNVNESVLVRIHSECLTGDIFGSLRCDCGAQKEEALKQIFESKNGVLIYLRQEGRGIGLFNKIKTYILQEGGMDTHDANIAIGRMADEREYSFVSKVFKHLGIKQIKLLTNNPDKLFSLERQGFKVVDMIPLVRGKSVHNEKYFLTKKEKFQHLL